MTPERWQKVGELYHAALERALEQRAQFLDQACDGDADLRQEVEGLLAAEGRVGSFMSGDAMEDAARMLAEEQTGALIGQTISHYRVLELLGQGGMGEVYLAEDTHLKRKVALKLLPAYFVINRDRVNRFEQEARAISALNHPNIVTIHEVGRVNGSNFIVTEFVEGETLCEMLSAGGFDISKALDLSIQIASALDAAHKAGIIHRDVKPENIMVRRDGYVKVLDFGLAKLIERQAGQPPAEATTRIFARTQPGLIMGSTSYMSPEQVRAIDVDERTDVWSLGVVLYEMLTGFVPFEGETQSDVIAAILERQPPSLAASAPGQLQWIVDKALTKNRAERYQTMAEMLSYLRELKQELDARAHLERGSGSAESPATNEAALAAGTLRPTHATSSTEYIVSGIKKHKTGAAFGLAIIAAVAVVVVFTGAYLYFFRNNELAGSGETIDSVAVLPFINTTNDPNTEYLAEGVSEGVIDRLSRLRGLRVNSLNSVLRYKGKQIEAQAIGRELNVRALLIGRLNQQGDHLVISTELIDARDNRRLWGRQYNRKMSDILVVEDEIAWEIARKLSPQLTAEGQKQLVKRNTENSEAYHLYSLGNYYLRKDVGREGALKSIEYFNQAIEADPNYAAAYYGLFKSYFVLGSDGQIPPNEIRPKIEWAALKAVELDDSSAAAHASLGFVKKMNWDWPGAEKEYQRAIELDPNNFDGYFGLHILLINVGRFDEALPLAKRAQELDELKPPRKFVAFAYLYKRQFDEVIEDYREVKKRNPDRGFQHVGEAYLGKGMYDEAVAELEKTVKPDDLASWRGYPILAYAYAAAGKRDKALKILNEQKKLAKQRYISPFNFAIIYTGLGDKDRAFEYLNKSIEERVQVLYHFPHRPIFEPLRSDPRYENLLRRMNFPG